ncbi:MAG TPA: Calx-beta domain-containing protein [Vicinamibacterales bacterium]|jgi:probable HAF family extracellular repeat protein
MTASRSSTALFARFAAIALILSSSFGTESPRGAAPPYTVIDLGTFGTVQSAQALEVNDAGQVVGVAGGNKAFLWQNGVKTQLGALAGGSASSALAVNEAGHAVGHSALTTPPTGAHAVLWSNGGITDLTPDLPANQTAMATGINEDGVIVGNIFSSSAFIWENGVRTALGDLGGGGTAANDINDSGVVVGASSTGVLLPLGFMAHPFMWQNGVMTDLGLLPGDEDGGASAINRSGQIVGSSGRTDLETYESFYKAFLYSNGVMTALPVPSWEAYAGDINDAGVVVGTMRAGGGFSNFHAWVYIDGAVTNLNTLIQPGSGLHIAYANSINNAGQIAATAFDAQGHYHAVLLTPGDGPPPMPMVSIADAFVFEGNTGTQNAGFLLNISPMTTGPVTVRYATANGTAIAGSDYDAVSGTVTIPAGRTTWAVYVTVRSDRKREPDEVFYVNLSNPNGGTIGDAQGVGTIRNDDR